MPKNPYSDDFVRTEQSATRRGIRHSDIMRRRGENVSSLLTFLDKTNFGLGKTLEKNKRFSVDVQTLAPGSATSFGSNDKETRVIYVIKGSLFIKYEENQEVVQRAFSDGSYFVVPPGMKHNYASSGNSEVSVLVVSGGDYAKNFKEEEEGVVSVREIEMPSQKVPVSQYVKRDKSSSRAKVQAAELKAAQDKFEGGAGQKKAVSPFAVLSDPNYKVVNQKPKGAGGIASE